ncbi:MAG: hypothetical protein AAGB32_01570, partial [Pseudomonadota bacterium]
NSEKIISAIKKPFQAISFSTPASVKKPVNIILKKAHKAAQSLKSLSQQAYAESACVTVFGHHDKTLRFGNDSVL